MKTSLFLPVFLIIFLFSLLFIGCSENENIDIDTETTTSYSLNLLAPVESIEPSFCCIEFEWSTDFDGESRLQLANDALFTDLILDTLVDTQSFSLETALAPNTQFYWAIEINDTLREVATFTTEDITTSYSLNLLAPVESIEPSFCCIEFEWSSDFEGESRLQLANDALFTDLILDTLVDAQSFSLEIALAPNTQFYWAIEINDTLREVATFTTEDVISPYEGIYSVEMTKHRWTDGSQSWDTTYLASIEIIVEDNSVYLIDSSSSFAEYHHFHDYDNQYLITYTYDSQSPYNSGAFVKFDLQTDSIFGGGTWGLLGGGTYWDFRGKIE